MKGSNEHSELILKKYLEKLVSDNQQISFFLLSGSQSNLKVELVKKLSKEILGGYFLQDFLHIKDFSQILDKPHILKIEYDSSNEVSKQLMNHYSYVDLGVRDINNRLSLSSLGKNKIVLIENIERMNMEAMNGFLKTCEEPLPNRIIIATTSNKASLLDTIVSRAVTIPFFDYSYDELMSYCNDKGYFVGDENLKSLICMMSMGKVDQLDMFNQKFLEDEELKAQFSNILRTMENGNIGEKNRILMNIYNNKLLDPFLDGIICYYILHDKLGIAENRLNVKKYLNSNVKVEHLIFYGLL